MKDRDKGSFGEFLAVALVGVSSPVIRIVISRTASAAGKASWVSPILAATVIGALAFFILDLCTEEGVGLFDALCGAVGKTAGRIIAVAYGLFELLMASMVVREYGERLVSTIFAGWSVWVFVGTLLLLGIFAAQRSIHSLGMAAKIFGKIIMVVGVVVILFSLKSVNIYNVFPVIGKDVAGSAVGTLSTISAFSVFVHMGFLMEYMHRHEKAKLISVASCFAMCAVVGTVLFVAVGVFGVEYVAHSSISFFALAKGVRIFDVAQHIESIVVAAWVLSDFVLVVVEIMALKNIFGRALGVKNGKTGTILIGAALFALAVWGFNGTMQIEEKIAPVLQPLNVVVNVALVVLIWCANKIRKKTLKKIKKSS